jgi:deferrochelatase/peroxidase EfeB
VRDPTVADEAAYGSYFVFRQLEQNVAGFKSAEDVVNTRRPNATFATNADSIVVGRLENGTPIERSVGPRLTDSLGHTLPVSNAFLFTTNPPRCPYFSHIRKVNPRTEDTQARLMIRRGITYGTRLDRIVDQQGRFVLPDEALRPHKDVGLLFQSYQASIEDQFEFAQTIWANTGVRSDKPEEIVGIDPVIGQPGSGKDEIDHANVEWPLEWGQNGTAADMLDFYTIGSAGKGPYVKLMGGGYFFAPSLPGLASIFI